MREAYPSFDLIRRFIAGLIDASLIVALDIYYSQYWLSNVNLAHFSIERYQFKLRYNQDDILNSFNAEMWSKSIRFDHDLLMHRATFLAGIFVLFLLVFRILSASIGMRLTGIKFVTRFFGVPLNIVSSAYCSFIATTLFLLFGHDVSLLLGYFLGQQWLLGHAFVKFSGVVAFSLWFICFVMSARLRLSHGSQSIFEEGVGLMTVSSATPRHP